jgi:hypothetical protein
MAVLMSHLLSISILFITCQQFPVTIRKCINVCMKSLPTDYPFGIIWLPLWYLLIIPLVSSDYPFGIFWLPLCIFCLPLWYLLITPLVSSDYSFGIFWLPLRYLLITSFVSSDHPFGIFWLPLWYLLITTFENSRYMNRRNVYHCLLFCTTIYQRGN